MYRSRTLLAAKARMRVKHAMRKCVLVVVKLYLFTTLLVACSSSESPELAGTRGAATDKAAIAWQESNFTYDRLQEVRQELVGDGTHEPSSKAWEEIRAYEVSLIDKKLEGWNGWVEFVSPPKATGELESLDMDTREYTVRVSLDAPPDMNSRLEGPITANAADLVDVPRHQVEDLLAWQNFRTSVWQKVVFTGTIVDLTLGANVRVFLHDTSIEPVN
jgi:hypothetical protein